MAAALEERRSKTTTKGPEGTTVEPNQMRRRRKRGQRPKRLGDMGGHVAVVLLALLGLAQWASRGARAALLQGCDFGDDLCDAGEVCVPDGLFGQCYSDAESALLRPLILDRGLTALQSELLRAELGRLAAQGADWPDARAQCVLAYFKMAVAFRLDYDTEFCTVRNPENIWALVQRVQNVLLAEEEAAEAEIAQVAEEAEAEADNDNDEGQSLLMGEPSGGKRVEEAEEGQKGGPEVVEVIPILVLDEDEAGGDGGGNRVEYELAGRGPSNNGTQEEEEGAMEKRSATADGLSGQEEADLDKFVHKLLESRTSGTREAGALNEKQIGRLVQFIRQLQNILEESALQKAEDEAEAEVIERLADAEEAAAEEDAESARGPEQPVEQVLLLKKDSEQFDNADMGLANTVHKIVKGGIQRVEGNRVYLKVAKEKLTEEELYKLITYLDRKIAQPNNLYFDEFLYEDGQLSFRISLLDTGRKDKKGGEGAGRDSSAVENASGVAQAVFKRRKDIQTLAGVRVDETGIGSGEDVVPVERSRRDLLVVPIMAVCALTIATLLGVLAVNLVRMRRRRRDTPPVLPQVISEAGGKKATKAGAEQPHGVVVVGGGGDRSKHSSTSSWPGDESAPAPGAPDQQLDISTGHVLLSFLQQHLDKPGQISREWESVREYANGAGETREAQRPENAALNADPSVVPYDDSRVSLRGFPSSTIVDVSPDGALTDYINASKILDADPEPAYIAAQAPQENTVAQFWQMVWEQGVAVLVNLCDQEETKSGRYAKYWPDEGSKVFGMFEVHLVSEHIWSEHYIVRSLYLKNTGTGETRTVTQFHFLTWPDGGQGLPASNKALLEFRRKVSKSYRGRASPVLVHCWNGAGRTGCYCLIDLVINRIQKGVKELNIAASLEHLRDQRMGMVESEAQYKCVFSCVAEEVSTLLKGLHQQQH